MNISNRKSVVEVVLRAFIPNSGDWTYTFKWDCGVNRDDYAGLLAHALREHIWNKVKAAREEAYRKGWKDAKAKRQKATWQSGALDQ